MKKLILLLIGLTIFQLSFSQKNTLKKQACNKGTYWLYRNYDKKNPDSIRVFGSIRRVNKNLESDPYGYLLINKIKYKADKDGKFDFKIKPGKYSVYAKNPFTYGIITEIIKFDIGVFYEFSFYLNQLPPIAD
ncbi:MAG: hypothetical protein H0W75_02035 [Chitinophagaceae bacterium]|nr:hypothetical protein [Chitinophagaceae bacterium]